MTTGHGNILERGSRMKRLLALSAATAFTALALSNPASAAVRADKSITVFHNIDMVGAAGYNEGEDMTVEVFRNGILIGSAAGPAVSTPEGAGLEVNHGPAGDPNPGDCWDGTTPDILPGDEVRVTGDGGTDTLVVPNVDFTTQDAVLVTADNRAQYPEANVKDVVVEGVAFDQAGNPIAPGALAGEVRNVEAPRYRAEPNQVVGLGGGAWRAIYEYGNFADVQNSDGITSDDVKQQKILEGEHSMVYAPLTQETYISDQGAKTGPGPGCEGVAPSAAHAVASFDDKAVNIGSGTLVASGTTTADAESVQVNLSDGANSVSQNATVNGSAWTATFSRDQLNTLGDGTLTASGVYNVADPNNPDGTGALNGATKQIQKDTVAPGNATATPPGGVYGSAQSVTLDSPEDNAQVRFTTNGNDPSATAGQVYNGQQIQITSDQTIKAVVVDAAGNPGQVASFAYQIDRVAPGLTASLAGGSYDTPQSLSFSSNEQDAKIYYTTDGSTPDVGSTLYEGPINIDKTQTVKAVAIDAAGNASQVQERTITIRRATTTNLNVASTDLKLGSARTIRGNVGPNQAGGIVRVTIDRPGTLANATRSFTLDGLSRYSFSYKPGATGTYRITATFVKDADSLGSTSETKSFRVVR